MPSEGIRALAVRTFGSVGVTRHRVPQTVSWTSPPGARHHVVLLLPLSGRVTFADAGADADASAPAVGVAFPACAQPGLRFEACDTADALWLPVGVVAEPMPACLPAPLSDAVPTLALRTFLAALLSHDLRSPEGEAWAERHLVRLGDETVRASCTGAQARGGALTAQARALMRRRRADPVLSPAVLADELHVSVRHLQRAFAEEGASPADELSRMRVELAIDLLRTDSAHALSITALAERAGFTSAGTLRRAFLRHQGVLPLAARTALRLAHSAGPVAEPRKATGKV